MDYLIYDQQSSFEINNKSGSASLTELPELLSAGSKQLSLALIKVDSRVITSESDDPEIIEEIASEYFKADQLLQFEQLSARQHQVFAVDKEYLGQIKAQLKEKIFAAVVPYPVALRSFLIAQQLNLKGFTIFLDERLDSVILTIFNQGEVTAPRLLPKLATRLVFELIRSAANYRNERGLQNITFSLVTNSSAVKQAIEELCDHPIIDKPSLVLVDELYPALAGLKAERDLLRFILPEELERAQADLKQKRYLGLFKISSLLCALTFIFYLSAAVQGVLVKKTAQELAAAKSNLNKELSQTYLAKHRSLVTQGGVLALPAYALRQILVKLPTYLYQLESIELQKGLLAKPNFVIKLVKRNNLKGGLEHLKQLFPQAQIYETLVQERTAVVMTIPAE